MNFDVFTYFNTKTPSQRKSLLHHYNRLIEIENNNVYVRKDGRVIKLAQMPYMLPAWTKGRDILIQCMKSNNEEIN